MKIEYDPEQDILVVEFLPEVPVANSDEYDGIIIDYSEERKIIGMEILDASKRTSADPLESINVEILKTPRVV